MSRMLLFVSASAILAVGVMLVGCSSQPSGKEPSSSPEPSQEQSATASHKDHGNQEHGDADNTEHSAHSMHGDHADALSELSPEDRALAEKQKVCPVSGEPLGAMGKPHKVTVKGRDVLLCCPGCESKIKADPEKYLAKLPK